MTSEQYKQKYKERCARLATMLRVNAPPILVCQFALHAMQAQFHGKYKTLFWHFKYVLHEDFERIKRNLWFFYQEKIRRRSRADIERLLGIEPVVCHDCEKETLFFEANTCEYCEEEICISCEEWHFCNAQKQP